MGGPFFLLSHILVYVAADNPVLGLFGQSLPRNIFDVGQPIQSVLPTIGSSFAPDNPPNVMGFLGQSLINVGRTLEMVPTVGSSFAPNNTPNVMGFLGQGLPREILNVGQPVEVAVNNLGTVVPVESLGQQIQKEIQTVKQPVDVTVTYVGSSQCAHVKKLFGVSYEQLQGDYEPNLNNLVLFYKTRSFTTIINITSTVEALRHARKFDADERLVIFLHGFTDDPTRNSFTNMTNSFLEKGHVSLIALDASSLIRWLYLRSSTYVRFIGQKLAQVLADVVAHGQDPSLIHIIGHSLGSHIAGFTGKTFQELTGKRIGRVSGLDPAGPCFSHVDPELRLKRTDADYVDVMHTDSGVLGISDAVGHKDYYPNSGTEQPNCLFQTCSHSRTWLLYGESVINPEAFPAVRCEDWEAFKNGQCDLEISYMGYPSKPGQDGKYFLQTGGSYPYGLGMQGVKYRNTDGIVKSIGSNIFG